MKARVIFINERELAATGRQYALASNTCNEQFDSVYINLEELIDEIQTAQNAEAEEMIKMQEQVDANGVHPDTTGNQAVWRSLNYLLSELKQYRVNR